MSFLLAPVFVTPLLKVPLLLSTALCTYNGVKPPTPIAQPKERARFTKGDVMGQLWTPNVMVNLAVLLRASLCGMAAAEAAALLAEYIPSSLSDRVLAFLFPSSNAGGASLYVTPLFIAGSALATAGGLMRIACHHALGRFFSWQMSVQDGHKLVTTGPYAIVRHPGYSGWFLLVIGNTLALLGPGSYLVASGLLNSRVGKVGTGAVMGYMVFVSYVLCNRIPREDEVLSKEFGEDWKAWSKTTPYRLIPYVY